MKSVYQTTCDQLKASPRRWLVTGAAGFIGSHLVETLLQLDQTVVGVDNFDTGCRRNLHEIRKAVRKEQWGRLSIRKGDIRDIRDCRSAAAGVSHVIHHAAIGSVPRSVKDPVLTNAVNIGGFLNVLVAAQQTGVETCVYASSSSIYGDEPNLPRVEWRVGKPLSPYAVSKLANELYAHVFGTCYGLKCIGLRYFNVYGPRQDPDLAYCAVIPKWIKAMIYGGAVVINGDGEISRDFCYVGDAVQASILAAIAPHTARGEVFNVGAKAHISLNELFRHLRLELSRHQVRYDLAPIHGDERLGDVQHCQADIAKAEARLGYSPSYNITSGLRAAVPWYLRHFPHRKT